MYSRKLIDIKLATIQESSVGHESAAVRPSTPPDRKRASMGPVVLLVGRDGAEGAGGGLPGVLCDTC